MGLKNANRAFYTIAARRGHISKAELLEAVKRADRRGLSVFSELELLPDISKVELEKIYQIRERHGRACSECGETTYLLPGQTEQNTPCDDCGEALQGQPESEPQPAPADRRAPKTAPFYTPDEPPPDAQDHSDVPILPIEPPLAATPPPRPFGGGGARAEREPAADGSDDRFRPARDRGRGRDDDDDRFRPPRGRGDHEDRFRPPGLAEAARERDEQSSEASTWAMACHLSVLFFGFPGPLVIWLLKKDEFALVNDAGRQALDFQITLFLLLLPSTMCVCGGSPKGLIAYLLAWALASLVFPVIAAVRVKQGGFYRFPICVHVFGSA